MRHRSEILEEAIRKTEKGFTVPEFDSKLRLLELEALVDIRDELTALITIHGSVEKIIYRER